MKVLVAAPRLAPRLRTSVFPLALDVQADLLVEDFKELVSQHVSLSPARQHLSLDKKVLLEGKTLAQCGVGDETTLALKDLGPQLGWRTVYVLEYLYPLLVHPLFYCLQTWVYGAAFEHSLVQKTAFAMVMAHFLKREFESLFIHRFSRGTMPAFNLVKNSFHYAILGGANLAYWVYAPQHTPYTLPRSLYVGCVVLFAVAEGCNLLVHVKLMNLRPAGTRQRRIPQGFGFDWVSCPNYFFELVAWLAFTVLTRSLASALFLVVGFVQMHAWARKKHRAYQKEFASYPPNRKPMLPFIA